MDYLSGLLYQLFLNADEHGSFDPSGERYEKGIRGIAVRVLNVTNVKSLVDVAGDDPPFKAYLIKQAFNIKAKTPDLVPEHTPFASFRLLEISVLDTGPGLALRWLGARRTQRLHDDHARARACGSTDMFSKTRHHESQPVQGARTVNGSTSNEAPERLHDAQNRSLEPLPGFLTD